MVDIIKLYPFLSEKDNFDIVLSDGDFLYLAGKAQKPKQRRESTEKSEKYGKKFKLTGEHLPYGDWLKAEAYYLFLLKVKIHVKSSSWTKIYQRREERVVGFRSPCP